MYDDFHAGDGHASGVRVLRDPEWKRAVGERLVRARTVLGKSQAQLARGLGISAQRLANYEGGSRPFDIGLATVLAEKYGITLDYIYRGQIHGLPMDIAERIEPLRTPENFLRN